MTRLAAIQQALREEGLDGWLFFDHHRRDPLAYRILQFAPAQPVTRRWYYYVPASGEPRGMVHKIEPEVLAPLEGAKLPYAGWRQQGERLGELLDGQHRIAMQYSPLCAVPYVANVDAGTLELVRSTGVEVCSSANLVQVFEACWSAAQYDMHKAAGRHVDRIRAAAFSRAAANLGRINEFEIQQFIREEYAAHNLVIDHGPIVAVNGNASNPHYEPTRESSCTIREGDLLLIDLWAKFDQPGAVYYDITWAGYCGAQAPERMRNVFAAVAGARDAAVRKAQEPVELRGFEVDDAAREYLRERGLAEFFFHRTGHSIGEDVHGNGANMDNFETHDDRKIIAGTCFSVEPGVYLPEFGIRSEVNVFRHAASAEVTGETQTKLLELLA